MRKPDRSSRFMLPLLLATGLVAACQPQATTPDAGDQARSTPAQADAAGPAPAVATTGDPAAAVRAGFEKFLAVESYRARMASAGGGAPATTLEFVAPDRYRIKMGEGMEQVRIGSDMYSVVGGKAVHSKAGDGMPSPRQSSQAMVASLASARIESLGEDTVDGESARVYRIATTQPAPGETKVWISDDSGLPLKSEATVPGTASAMLIEYSDYNDPSIRIEPPAAD